MPCEQSKNHDFIISQVGEDYPYHWPIEFFENAFAYLSEHSWFYQRPVEEDNAQTAKDQRALEAANANLAAAKANEIRIVKKMPLNELATFTSVENAKLREARDRGESPDRPLGQSSRPLGNVTMGLKATARANVALANPSLDRNGAEFGRLYALELSRLRS